MTGTVDLLFIRGVDQFDITDVNLLPPTASAGEGGRLLYGTIDEFGAATPNRRNQAFQTVAEIRNSSGDHTISASGQLEKRFRSGTEVTLAYTYTDARDRISPDCFNVTCNLDFTPAGRQPREPGPHDLDLLGEAQDHARGDRGGTTAHPGRAVLRRLLRATLHLHDQRRRQCRRPLARRSRQRRHLRAEERGGHHPGRSRPVARPRQPDPGAAVPAITAGADHAEEQLPGALGHAAQCAAVQGVRDGRRALARADHRRVQPAQPGRPGLGRAADDPLVSGRSRDPPAGAATTRRTQRGVYNAPPIDRHVRDDGATRWRMQLGARYTF